MGRGNAVMPDTARRASIPWPPNFSGQNQAFNGSFKFSSTLASSQDRSLGPAACDTEVNHAGMCSLPGSCALCLRRSSSTRLCSAAPICKPRLKLRTSDEGAWPLCAKGPLGATPMMCTFSRSRVSSQACPCPHSWRTGMGISSSRSLRISPSSGLRRCSMCIRTAVGSLDGLPRMARATCRPSLCTRRLRRSWRHVSTESFCTSVSCVICSAMDSEGAPRCSLLLAASKLFATTFDTVPSGVSPRIWRPTAMRFSLATRRTSSRSRSPMAGHAGTPPCVRHEGRNFCWGGGAGSTRPVRCVATETAKTMRPMEPKEAAPKRSWR
mmetsp:Transcript_55322/g.124647  ORF Transcript_55322/g.124647 Transcript_55322/m.124647 type:complete len:325 (-) Transcript_55322:231-1205(-)